jgi:hypothetical protein
MHAQDVLPMRQEECAGRLLQTVGGAQGRRSRCKACYKELERETYARDPRVQAVRRRLVAKWRDEGLDL